MNTRIINHDEAVRDLMAERYLLGELNAADREAYEEHLFSCDACFEQVKVGTEFIAHLRHIGTDDPQTPLAPGFMSRLMMSARQPLTVTVFGFMLFAGGVAIHQRSEISRLKEPRPEIRSVLTGVAHGSNETNLIRVPRNSALSLNVNIRRRVNLSHIGRRSCRAPEKRCMQSLCRKRKLEPRLQ
jgi:hypothetical protein